MDTLFQCAFTVLWCIIAAALFSCALYTKRYLLLWFFLFAVYRAFFRYRLLAERQYSLLAKQYGTEKPGKNHFL